MRIFHTFAVKWYWIRNTYGNHAHWRATILQCAQHKLAVWTKCAKGFQWYHIECRLVFFLSPPMYPIHSESYWNTIQNVDPQCQRSSLMLDANKEKTRAPYSRCKQKLQWEYREKWIHTNCKRNPEHYLETNEFAEKWIVLVVLQFSVCIITHYIPQTLTFLHSIIFHSPFTCIFSSILEAFSCSSFHRWRVFFSSSFVSYCSYRAGLNRRRILSLFARFL